MSWRDVGCALVCSNIADLNARPGCCDSMSLLIATCTLISGSRFVPVAIEMSCNMSELRGCCVLFCVEVNALCVSADPWGNHLENTFPFVYAMHTLCLFTCILFLASPSGSRYCFVHASSFELYFEFSRDSGVLQRAGMGLFHSWDGIYCFDIR